MLPATGAPNDAPSDPMTIMPAKIAPRYRGPNRFPIVRLCDIRKPPWTTPYIAANRNSVHRSFVRSSHTKASVVTSSQTVTENRAPARSDRNPARFLPTRLVPPMTETKIAAAAGAIPMSIAWGARWAIIVW